MIKEHRPLYIKRLFSIYEHWYVRHFIAPQFASLGENPTMLKPWHIDLYGAFITAGKNLHIIAGPDRHPSLSTWQFENYQGHINIGDHCLICPGVRIDSGSQITIGDNCMFAASSYITDSDWHDIYDRTKTVGTSLPVILGDNVWIGDGAKVCKGVTIGDNSVIGAGAIVTSDIPANSIAAGNPARVIKPLDPDQTLVKREQIFADPEALQAKLDAIDAYMLTPNTLWDWLRSKYFPRPGD
ncbi:MAG: acetyltransferase-like isoleucine patch superfamily enzyme [Candidatus Azotimanducaceae bacterium]|jgi:acetyltransferase-like isoleucine patch superfamily enzyme